MQNRRVLPQILFVVTVCITMATISVAQFTQLHNFSGPDGNGPATMALLQGPDGNFYGTTRYGGSAGHGVVFKMTPSGTVSVLYSFQNTSDGENPVYGLVLGGDGNFYGSTRTGGAHCCGTVFKITPAGVLTTIYSFSQTDGAGPQGTLVHATDGNFYGITYVGGANGYGEVFKVTPTGTLTILYSFCPQSGCPDGRSPEGGLVQANDGNFYGTTEYGGDNGQGVIYRITPSGTYTKLHSFNFTDGSAPADRLIQATDGNLYGTAFLGGDASSGTIFKITLSGTFTRLFSFCPQLDCSAGTEPLAGLIQASDGNFYGTTTVGGSHSHGTIYKMTPNGSVSALYSFCAQRDCTDGAGPQGEVVQANDGNFYGTTTGGGTGEDGTAFRFIGPQLIPTSTTLATTPNPSHLNQTVTMTATVHAQSGTPIGNVVFTSDGVQIGIASLSNGVAVLNYSSLPLGTHSIVAVYQGGNGFGGSTSNAVQQVVQLPLSTTTVMSNPNPSTVGQQVTITATVGPAGPPQPTGNVSFTSNGSAISGCTSVTLNSGTAQCVTSSLPVGTDMIVAAYSGDSNYSPSSGTLVQIVNPVPQALQFMTLPTCRVVDTRGTNGTFGGPPIQGNQVRSFPLTEGDNPCGIPADAVAYSLNVTVAPMGRLGYLTIWPTGEGQPIASTLNSPDGRTKANAAIIPAGTPSGSVSIFVPQTTNVILDINGYFVPAGSHTLAFYAVTPCRVIDTRGNNGDLGGPYLLGGRERDFLVLESNCNLPSTAAAYSMNFTVVPKGPRMRYLTVWPKGQSQPGVSTLNDQTGTNVANAAIVPAGASGGIATYVTDDTDLIVDVDGYFAPPQSGGLSFYALTPCRVLDTRQNNGYPFSGELTVQVEDSPCGPPATSQAYVFNATVVPNGALNYLTLWPDTEDQPGVSTLNAKDGFVTSNMAIVPNVNGKTDAWAQGSTQLILDISGYFAP